MLDPNYLLHAVEGAEELAEKLHQDIIKRIVERINIRFARGDDYILTATDKWQIQTLQEAGFLLEDIQKEISKATPHMAKEIAEAMEDAGVKTLEYDDKIYKAAGLSPDPLALSPHLIRILQRDYEATMGEWENLTGTTANAAQQTFIRCCDNAYRQAITGSISPAQAVREALEEVIKGGVTVEYPTGHKDTIETATARAVRTGIGQASAHITDARMEEMGWDIILVSSHLGARVTEKEDFTNHYWWQGKFYSKSGEDSRFPPFSVCGMGDVQGIHGANCRHSHGPGDGEHNPYEHYNSEENRKQYKLNQRQRVLERRIRKTKRDVMGWRSAMDAETDPVKKAEYEAEYQRKAALLQKQNGAYNEFCEENNLKKQAERIRIAKWDRSQAAKAARAAKKYNDQSIANENSQRKQKETDYSVNWKTVQDNSYERKFNNLSSSPEANHAALVRAKWALNNRDGMNTEELYALDMRNGTEIARITDQQYPNGVKRTEQFDGKLYAAKTTGANIMLIHNHPSGSPPSVGDLNALLSIPGAYGITVGHDGSVYKYTSPKIKVKNIDFEVAILRYKRYSYITAHEKALTDIAEKYGFTFERM